MVTGGLLRTTCKRLLTASCKDVVRLAAAVRSLRGSGRRFMIESSVPQRENGLCGLLPINPWSLEVRSQVLVILRCPFLQ